MMSDELTADSIRERAEEGRDKFLSAWREVRDDNVFDHHPDELAYINHLAEGDADEPKPDLIENLVDRARYLNVKAAPGLGSVAPLDTLKELRASVLEIEQGGGGE